MAATVISEALQEFVTCVICTELFEDRNPRSLPCLHSFCSPCIQKLLDITRRQSYKRTDDIPCPICQIPATIPEGGNVSKLPAYFITYKIQDILKKIKEKYSVCNSCSKAEVVSYCFVCTNAVCSTCTLKHDRLHKNHAQVKVSASIIAYMVCESHDKYVDAFCIDCSRAVCSACSLGKDHINHRINRLTCDVTPDSCAKIKGTLETADEQYTKLSSLQCNFNAELDTTSDKMARHHESVIKQLEKQHREFQAQIKKRRDEVNLELDSEKTRINKLKRKTERLRQPIFSVPDVMVADVRVQLDTIRHHIPPTKIPVGAHSVNKLEFVSSGQLILGDLNDPTKDIKEKEGKESTLSLYEPRKTRTLWDIEGGISGIAFMSKGDLITARFSGLEVFDQTKGKKLQHTLSDLCKGEIQAVSVDTQRSIVAAVQPTNFVRRGPNPGILYIVKEANGRWEQKIHETCEDPRSVVCTGDGHFVVGGGNKAMHKYDACGEQMWGHKLTFSPENISIDHKNRILVSNSIGGRVLVYSHEGAEMFSFPKPTDQMKIKPRGLCVDADDNILVADERSKAVLLYDENGEFVRQIMKMPGKPCHIALQDKYLAVGIDGGWMNKLFLYEII